VPSRVTFKSAFRFILQRPKAHGPLRFTWLGTVSAVAEQHDAERQDIRSQRGRHSPPEVSNVAVWYARTRHGANRVTPTRPATATVALRTTGAATLPDEAPFEVWSTIDGRCMLGIVDVRTSQDGAAHENGECGDKR
jgi:hypothetical protein